ncbi:MAG: ATP-binding cassette domain-containing protein [Myxococcales bacterium]|nr:ATP-binding cassette domain-containing protein [Myxococcales bacterium]
MQALAPFRRIVALARPEVRTLVIATVALLITSGLGLAYPLIVQRIVDGVLQGGGVPVVTRYSLLLLVLFAATAIFTAVRMYFFTVAGERIVTRLRQRLYSSLVQQEIGFFDAHRTGELTNRLAADTTVVQNAATVNISMLLRYLFQAIGAVAILMLTSWRLTLVMLALVPVAVVGALFYGRFVRKLSRQVQDALARATEVSEETLGGIRTVRAFAREAAESARYAERVEESFRLARHRARVNAVFGAIASFAGFGAISGVLWYGGVLLAEGRMSMGELTSFLLYTFSVAFAIGALGSLYQDFQRAIGSSERIFELIERVPQVVSGTERPAAVRGEVRFDGVDFAYPTRSDVPVLQGVDLKLAPGEVVALVGPSGGGKSTIAALLSRFYDPDRGEVRLDGVDLRTLDADWLRHQVGVVSQEPILFAASIRENIMYGKPDADEAAVRRAAEAANAAVFVEKLPGGYDTEVGERGVRLSGGQKQRIAIARALLEDPPILVLDEATSALDAESEHLVQEALGRLMAGRTTLVIAHRLSTVKSADRIVVIDGGRVVQSGSHGALLADGGLYRQLVERQLAA